MANLCFTHTWKSHFHHLTQHIDDSCDTWMRQVIRISMSHFTHITHRVISHVSCHTHGWVTSCATHMNKPCVTFTHDITHVDEFHITWRMWISLMLSHHPQTSVDVVDHVTLSTWVMSYTLSLIHMMSCDARIKFRRTHQYDSCATYQSIPVCTR